MFLAIVIIFLGLTTAIIAYFRKELSSFAEEFTARWLWSWAGRGALAPIFVWILLNVGSMPLMPPLTRNVAKIRLAGHWVEALVRQTSLAASFIVCCWAVLTCGWFVTALIRRAHNREDLIIATIVWSPVSLILALVFVRFGGWMSNSFAALVWFCPLMQYLLMEAHLAKPMPSYSKAIGKMKFGKYGEAEMAILNQLEKCENDFDGWMMLAELYAQQFSDLDQAEQTILELCAEPHTTLSQVSIALHRLADWQLTLRHDPVGARRVLEEIVKRMPGTHLATMAQLRINQLPVSEKDLAEQQHHKTFVLPNADAVSDVDTEAAVMALSRVEAAAAANQLVEQLEADPKDIVAREKLARLFAGPLAKLDLALEQLEELVEMPEAPPAKAAEWLSLMASWELKHHGESEAWRATSLRLIHEFPQSKQAFAAQKKLNLARR